MKLRFGITFVLLLMMIFVKVHLSTMTAAAEWYSCEVSSDGILFLATDKGIDLYIDFDLWKHIPIPNPNVHYMILYADDALYMIEHSYEYMIDLDTLQFTKISPTHSFSEIERERFQPKKNGEYTVQLQQSMGNYWVEYRNGNQTMGTIRMDTEAYLWKVLSWITTSLLLVSGVITIVYCLKSGEYHYPKLRS